MGNLVINECHFGEEDSQEGTVPSRSRNKSGFKTYDNTNPLNPQVGATNSGKGPVSRGNREFRTSFDATNDPSRGGRPNTSLFDKTHKERKFTLSFDGSMRPSTDAQEDFLIKFDEGNLSPFKPSSFKTQQRMNEDDDKSFEFEIEDDYLSEFNERLDTADTRNKGSKLELQPTSTDRNTRDSTQDLQSKAGRSNDNYYDLENVLFFFQQESTDSWVNNMSTSDDFSLFINYMENIRRRINRRGSLASGINDSSGIVEESKEQKSANKNETSELKEAMINNYVEIIELRDKINESTFDLILK